MTDKTNTNKTPKWLVPGYPQLKSDDPVGKAAVDGQIWYYPKVVRTMTDPPISGQRQSLVSFMLFKEPRKLRNGTPVYGYLKCRGNWADANQSKYEASKIIREVDSKYKIRIAPTGAWVPITNETAFEKEKLDVKMRKDEISLRDEAVKEKEARQRKIMREIREREDELKKGGDIYDNKKSLDYYSMRRVTHIRLIEARENMRRQIKSYKEKIQMVAKELKTIDIDYKEYKNKWIDRYNVERRKGGLPDYVPSEDHIEEYEQSTFKNLKNNKKDDDSDLSDEEYTKEKLI